MDNVNILYVFNLALYDLNSLRWMFNEAPVRFNIGNLATLPIYGNMGMAGGFCIRSYLDENKRRLKYAKRNEIKLRSGNACYML